MLMFKMSLIMAHTSKWYYTVTIQQLTEIPTTWEKDDLFGQKQFVFQGNIPTRWKINFSFLCKCFYTKINLALNIQWWTFMGK